MTSRTLPPLLELQNVGLRRGQPPLQHIDLSLEAGQCYLITGENGSGKSTLLALMRGDLSPSEGTRRYFLGGQRRVAAVQAKVQFPLVSPEQEAFYLQRDTVQTVADVLLSGLSGERLNLWQADNAGAARVQQVAALLHLNKLLARDIRTLSHGQRRRALLGRALMPRPAALLLDEFTDGLSPAARQELGQVLQDVAAQGTALVLVTHRPEEAPALPWQHLHIVGGRLTFLGELPPQARGVSPQPSPLPSEITPSGPDVVVAQDILAPGVLVELKQATVYRNGHHALGPIDWQWRRGEHWLVTGENGAGKSTFARLVAGEFYPALGGSVSRPFLRRDLLSERQQHIGLLGAEVGIRQRRDWTGYEVVASAFGGSEGFAAALSEAQEQRLHEVAQQLQVTDLLQRHTEQLSQGQLRRLLLARAIAHRPTLLILDEGVDFLDAASRSRFWALLPELLQGGTHLMVISHREADIPPGLSHHLELAAGQIVRQQAHISEVGENIPS